MRRLLITSASLVLIFLTIPAWGGQLKDAFDAVKAKNFTRAYLLLHPLAENGDKVAQGLLGDLYSRGHGVPRDPKEAVVWWQRAAKQGEPYSQLALGDAYAKGRGVGKDWSMAAKWYGKAAQQNIPRAEAFLGFVLYQGLGVPKNKIEAAKWFTKAAKNNNAFAQAMLSEMYFLGAGSLKSSVIEADKWAIIAGNAGEKNPVISRDVIEGAMTAEQKYKAIHLAEEWKFKKGLRKTPPTPSPTDDTEYFFVKDRQLEEKCLSNDTNDLAWCNAYIKGVVDTLGARLNNLKEDAGNMRFCIRKNKGITFPQIRQAVVKSLKTAREVDSGHALNDAASSTVIAGVLVYLCD